MSLDIVEIALDQFTDGALFEKIASEVMRDEGYHDIKLLGGAKDFGMDAVEDVFYEESGQTRIVFQFTIQDYVLGKLRETITKLRKKQIDFTELVIATTANLSTQRQETIHKTARKEFDVTVTCFHRGTILNRLSDYSNGIFHRFFPDIETQLRELREAKSIFDDGDDSRETALITTAIAFGMTQSAATVRKSLFDRMVLALLSLGDSNGLTASEIAKTLADNLQCNLFHDSQIEASLRRVNNSISNDGGRYSLKASAMQKVSAATTAVNSITESLVSDVIETVCAVSTQSVSINSRRRLERNTKDVLRELFRMNSMELVHLAQPDSKTSRVSVDPSSGLLTIASRQVAAELGNLLISALADVFSNPTNEQAEILAGWARVYLGVAVMNLDPVLRECQTSRIREKVFVLDTDVVLNAVVSEIPHHLFYRSLIASLVNLGVRVIVPEAVIEECARHAERSPKTYWYHKDMLQGMTPQLVDAQVKNLFVRAYYHGFQCGQVQKAWGFKQYLANYLETTNPIGFFREIVTSAMPDEVEIINVNELVDERLYETQLEVSRDKFLELMDRNKWSLHTRTPEQKRVLATTDARMMLTALHLNATNQSDKSVRLLWAKCYIVTHSTRYSKVASELDIQNVMSSFPSQLFAVIEHLVGPVVPDKSVVRLLENPLVVTAVNEIWPDLEGLLKNGIGLMGKSLVRLRHDLDATLHDALSASNEADKRGESAEKIDEFVQLADIAESMGYRLHPLASVAREMLASSEEKNDKIQELQSQLQELEEASEQFGKKKQRYLRRIARKKASNLPPTT